jgi:hypothetical protein
MSAPIRAQHRPPPIHHDRATIDDRQFAPSRIPAKLSSVERTSSKSTQHISRLASRPNRTERASDNAATKQAPIPLTAAPKVPRKDVVLPHSASAPQYYSRPSHFTDAQQPPPTTRTPSLFSGSSAQTLSSPRSHGLRRKPSTIDSYTAHVRAHGLKIDADRATMHSRAEGYNEALDDAVLGMRILALPHLQVRYHTWTHKIRILCAISRRPYLDYPIRRHLHPGIQTRPIAMSRHPALLRLTQVEL